MDCLCLNTREKSLWRAICSGGCDLSGKSFFFPPWFSWGKLAICCRAVSVFVLLFFVCWLDVILRQVKMCATPTNSFWGFGFGWACEMFMFSTTSTAATKAAATATSATRQQQQQLNICSPFFFGSMLRRDVKNVISMRRQSLSLSLSAYLNKILLLSTKTSRPANSKQLVILPIKNYSAATAPAVWVATCCCNRCCSCKLLLRNAKRRGQWPRSNCNLLPQRQNEGSEPH